jgi:UDP-2-acetamido-2-deoxy-ribo-hexuluronate aminotransferase
VQFIDLKAQQAGIRPALDRRIAAVLDHGQYIGGPEIQELEGALARFAGVNHCISCANGTDALQIALMAAGIGPGDAVFTTPFTFFATAEVIALIGATPVFVDIDLTCNIDPIQLELAIRRVKAEGKLIARCVIPVDLFGLCADYDRILPIAKEHGLMVLEDAAQAMGATYRGQVAPSLCTIGTTSFFPAKPLGCYGDGGAIFTDNDELAATCRSIAVHGKGKDKYDNVRIGLNSRLDTLQGAILLEKLEIFPSEIVRRQQVADAYTAALKDLVGTPVVPDGCRSVWAQYSVRSPQRRHIMAALKDQGIPTMIYYPNPLHLAGAFQWLGFKRGAFPVTEEMADEIFSLPMHPHLTEADVARVADVVKRAVA